jgi:hypothetical protein
MFQYKKRLPRWDSFKVPNVGVNSSLGGAVPEETSGVPVTPSMTPTVSITASQTMTPTPSVTPQPTSTPTNTPTPSVTPVIYDSGATVYLNALVIAEGSPVGDTISGATNTLFTTLRNEGILNKLFRIYPLVGSNPTAIGVEALNPGPPNLVFNGGWTFSSSGATPNGVNGYAETFVTPSISPKFSMGVYLNNGFSNNSTVLGSYDAQVDVAQISWGVGTFAASSNTTIGTLKSTTSQNQGFFGVTRISNSQEVFIQNMSATTFNSAYAPNGMTQILGARQSDFTRNNWFSRRISFVFQGFDLSSSEMITFYNAIQIYQTALNRQV